MMGDWVIDRMYAHASRSYPEECCGFIRQTSAGPQAIPVDNVHEMPRRHFKVSPFDFATYGNGALCMYHSHPDGLSRASDGDRQVYEVTGLPQVIVNWPHGHLSLHGELKMPLIGRPFIYGILDCYHLVRSYYAETYGIDLIDYPRPRYGWWEKGLENPFVERYESVGFHEEKDDIQPGDVVLMRLAGSQVANHVGVITEDFKLLNHRLNSFSCELTYDGYYRENTMKVLRYGH